MHIFLSLFCTSDTPGIYSECGILDTNIYGIQGIPSYWMDYFDDGVGERRKTARDRGDNNRGREASRYK